MEIPLREYTGGIAPECDLIVLKVLDQKGNGNVTEVMKAFRWLLENQKRISYTYCKYFCGNAAAIRRERRRKINQWRGGALGCGVGCRGCCGKILGPKEGTITTPGDSKKISHGWIF